MRSAFLGMKGCVLPPGNCLLHSCRVGRLAFCPVVIERRQGYYANMQIFVSRRQVAYNTSKRMKDECRRQEAAHIRQNRLCGFCLSEVSM